MRAFGVRCTSNPSTSDYQEHHQTVVMSMTAYSRVSSDSDLGTVTWELKSVNNRYLDASLRIPEEFRFLDGPLRERLGKRVRRGKVDGTLRIESTQRAAESNRAQPRTRRANRQGVPTNRRRLVRCRASITARHLTLAWRYGEQRTGTG